MEVDSVSIRTAQRPGVDAEHYDQITAEVEEQMKQKGIRGAAVVWMDDVLLGTPTAAEHAAATRLLYEVSLAHNIKYKPPQQVGLAEVVWAGFRLSPSGHQVALSRMEGIAQWPHPKTRQQLMKLCGWVQWAAQGVKHIAAPPTLLCRHQ